MKKLLYATIILLTLVSTSSCMNAQKADSNATRTFYIDSATGNDNNQGTARHKAWASLGKVNSITFKPGDNILFKAGSVYTGQLKPKGSGKEGKPIIIDMYGVGSKPRIDGKGLYLDTVLLENVEYWEVNKLEITNLGPKRQEWQTGIRVRANSFGTMHHIQLKNLYVHDVNGSLNKDNEGCGIIAQCDGKILSRFDGLLIEDCHVVRTDRNGICMRSEFTHRAKNWFPSLNVVMRGNLVEDCGGDAIKPWGAESCLVEYNVVNGGRQRTQGAAAGIWPWSCDNTIVQFNEVYNMKGTHDGQAFDADYNCRNSLFQYNYSHDNEGGFILACNNTGQVMPENIGNIGTIIRYNISQNDGEYSSGPIFELTGSIQDTTIYNNVVYIGSGLDVLLINTWAWGGGLPDNTRFYNNIFYVDGQARFNILPGTTNSVFENNVWYGSFVSRPSDPYAITSDPMLVNPGSGKDGLNSLDGYKLKAGSPCIGAGKSITETGGLDFWGNKFVGGKPSIGAHEKAN